MKSIASLIRNAYGGLTPSAWWLALVSLINRSGTMVIFFMSLYLQQELNYPLGRVGVVMAMFGIGSIVGVFIGGRLIDRIGYYPIMLWSLFSGGILFIVVSFLENYALLCIGIFTLSAFGEAFRPAIMSAIAYYSTPETYTRSMSLNRLALNLGFSVGPAVGGFLATYNYRLIFWVDGLTCLAAAAVIFFFLGNGGQRKPVEPEKIEVAVSPYADKAYLFFLPLAMLYAMAFFQFFSTMPLYYKDVENFSEAQIGWIMALNGIIVASVEMVLIYKLERRWSKYNFIALGAFLLALSYFALLFVSGFLWLAFVTVVISFSEMFAMPFMNTYMNTRALGSKGQFASLYVMAWSAAIALIPLLATQVIDLAGYSVLWLILGGFALLVMAGSKVLERMSEPTRLDNVQKAPETS